MKWRKQIEIRRSWRLSLKGDLGNGMGYDEKIQKVNIISCGQIFKLYSVYKDKYIIFLRLCVIASLRENNIPLSIAIEENYLIKI